MHDEKTGSVFKRLLKPDGIHYGSDDMVMTTLDIVILIVFVVSVILGFRKGIIVQAGALGGIILGIVLCRVGGDWMAARISELSFSGTGDAAPTYVDFVIANIILFIAGFLGVKAVAHFFKNITHALALGGLDRVAGAVFSLFEWMLVLSLLLNLWLVIKPSANIHAMSTLGNGHAIEAIIDLAPRLLGYALG